MSIATIETIMGRINAATEDSPIAVFACTDNGKLDAVFASTKITQGRIKRGDTTYVGSFYKGMKGEGVRAKLRFAMSIDFQLSRIATDKTKDGDAKFGGFQADYMPDVKLTA